MAFDEELSEEKDIIRDLLGDTSNDENELRSDTYYEKLIERLGSWESALVWAARSLIAEIGRQPVKIRLSDGLSVDYSARIPAWQSVIAEYGTASSSSYGFSFDAPRADGYAEYAAEIA